jgi:hypothetical protein
MANPGDDPKLRFGYPTRLHRSGLPLNSNVSAQIELYSPTTQSCEILLKRRTVQSYVEINFFPLDESGSPSAVNNTFLSFRIRDKKAAR